MELKTEEGSHVSNVLTHGKALQSEATALYSELAGAAEEVGRSLDLKGRMERAPYSTMAVAMGVGYVLGGGLFSNLTGKMMRVGTKLVLIPVIKRQLFALGEAAVAGATQGASAPGTTSGVAQGYAGAEDGNKGF